MKYTKDEIDTLDAIQKQLNNGRGVSCVQAMILSLRMNDELHAEAIRQNEGDKTASYPELEKYLTKMMGWRTHLLKNCKSWTCTRI